MRFWNASIFGRGARETATNVVSRCCRCTRIPSTLSASIEQLGQPSSHSGPSMKWYTASWLRPSNRSASVSLPFGPSKTYGFSIFTQGSARRSRASSSRCRVSAFSFASSASRAFVHSSCDTILGLIARLLPFEASGAPSSPPAPSCRPPKSRRQRPGPRTPSIGGTSVTSFRSTWMTSGEGRFRQDQPRRSERNRFTAGSVASAIAWS